MSGRDIPGLRAAVLEAWGVTDSMPTKVVHAATIRANEFVLAFQAMAREPASTWRGASAGPSPEAGDPLAAVLAERDLALAELEACRRRLAEFRVERDGLLDEIRKRSSPF